MHPKHPHEAAHPHAEKPAHIRQAHQPAPTNAALSDAEQARLRALELHTPAEIKSYLRPAEGLDRVVPIVAKLLASNPELAKVAKVDVSALSTRLTEARDLGGLAATAMDLYRRGYEAKLEAESDLTRALYRVNRLVANAEDQNLAKAAEELTEWVAQTHAHNTHPADVAPPPAEPATTTK